MRKNDYSYLISALCGVLQGAREAGVYVGANALEAPETGTTSS